MNDDIAGFNQMVDEVSQALLLPAGFLKRLPEEDDWSFVVKTHALYESVLAHLLISRFDATKAGATLARLALTTKLNLADDLGLLDAPNSRVVRKLAELRNRLVHDVQGLSFTFSTYLQDPKCSGAFADAFTRLDWAEDDSPASRDQSRSLTLRFPKYSIHMSTLAILGDGYIAKLRRQVETEQQFHKRFTQQLHAKVARLNAASSTGERDKHE